MIGIAVELGGIISDISKLNVTTDNRMVISKHRTCSDGKGEMMNTHVESVFPHYRVQEENPESLDN